VRYLVKCADDMKRVAAPFLLAGLGVVEIQALMLVCSTGLGCFVAVPLLGPAIGLTGFAAPRTAQETWKDREELFNFSDCTESVFFCGEH
jgi:hypothetical protein